MTAPAVGPLRAPLSALGWFTRLPVPAAARGDVTGAIAWLPAVGLVVAAVGVGARAVTAWAGPLASAVVAVAAVVAVTGAYHEDGLADTFDALWGGWSREHRLEILRDSRLGTYGVAALGLSLLLRVAVLAPLDLDATARVLVVGHVLGRATVQPLLAWLPRARTDGALAAVSPERGAGAWVLWLTVVVAAVTLAIGARGAALCLLAAAVAAGATGLLARRRIGGLTGDVLGAANQLAHLAAMLVAAGLVTAGGGA